MRKILHLLTIVLISMIAIVAMGSDGYAIGADNGTARAGNKMSGSASEGGGSSCTPGTPWLTYPCGGTSFRLYKLDINKPNATNTSTLGVFRDRYEHVTEEYIHDGADVRITTDYLNLGREYTITGCQKAGWYIRYGYEVAPGSSITNYGSGVNGDGFQIGVAEVHSSSNNTWSLGHYIQGSDAKFIDGGNVPYHLYNQYEPYPLTRVDGKIDFSQVDWDTLDGHRLRVQDVEDLFNEMRTNYPELTNGFTSLRDLTSEGGLGYFCFTPEESSDTVTFHSTSGVFPLTGGNNYLMTPLDGEHTVTQKTLSSNDPVEQTVNFTQYLYLDVGMENNKPKSRPVSIYSQNKATLERVPVLSPPATTNYRITTTVKTDGGAPVTTQLRGISDPTGTGVATTDYAGNNWDDAYTWNFSRSYNMWNYFLDNTQTVNVPSSSDGRAHTVEICQKIEYDVKSINYKTTDGVTTTEYNQNASFPYNTYACAVFTRSATSTPVTPTPTASDDIDYSCKIYGYATATPNYGNTMGFTGVQNMNRDSGANYGWHNTDGYYNGSNNSQTIYAKPGDSIQFHHCLTFGAQAVRTHKGNYYDHTTGGNRAADYPTSYMHDPRSRNWIQLDYATTYLGQQTNESNYFFNNANKFGYKYKIPMFIARPPLFQKYGYDKSDYVALIESPSRDTDYSCRTLSQSIEWAVPGYQVHSFRDVKGSCAASSKVSANDAGKTITQSMEYNYIEAWVYYKNNYTRGYCTPCENARNAAEYYNTLVMSYQTAKTTSLPLGRNVYHCDSECECDYPCGEDDSDTCCETSYHGPYDRWYYPVSTNTERFICNGGYTYFERSSSKQLVLFNQGCKDGSDIRYSNAPTAHKSATVIIPYNFTTSVAATSTTPASGVAAGENIETSVEVRVNARRNVEVSINTPYATTMPEKSKIEVVEFIIDDSVEFSSVTNRSGQDGGIDAGYMQDDANPRASSKGVCDFFSAVSGGVCNSIHVYNRNDSKVTKGFNIHGNINGETNATDAFTRTLTTTVPDIEVGQKYCVAVGVYPADSHNIIPGVTGDPSDVVSGGYNAPGSRGGINGVDNTGTYWNISRATCRTVTKRPSFQVWNGDTKASKIDTSVMVKDVGVGFTGETTSSHTIFGSWDEHNVLARSSFKYFSSGAMFGYATPTLNPNGSGLRNAASTTGGELISSDVCKYSPLTIANADCNSRGNTLGRTSIYSDATVVNKLRSRYVAPIIQQNIMNADFTPITTGGTDNNQKTYRYRYSGGDIHLDGTVISKNYNSGHGQDDSTYIVYTPGDVYIDGNICYDGNVSCTDARQGRVPAGVTYRSTRFDARPGISGSNVYNNTGNGGSYSGGFSNYLLQNGGTSYGSIDQLPQMIIFAKNIYISGDVTQIDAWLIATGISSSSFSVASGTVNTCYNTFINKQTPADSRNECGNQLVVNGPVFAGELLLNRTAGAFPGDGVAEQNSNDPTAQNILNDGSVTPAEVFNFRADAYLWAYGQAQDNRQAQTTYVRELPPRY